MLPAWHVLFETDQSSCSYAEKSINSILDYVSASPDIDTALMQKFYDETNKSLAEAKNEVRYLACQLLTA